MGAVVSEQFIAVDIGNNQVKLGVFAANHSENLPSPHRVRSVAACQADFDSLLTWLPDADTAWCVASVHRGAEQQLAAWVARRRPADTYHRLSNDELPIQTRVSSRPHVGADRLLAAVAVNRVRTPNQISIVVDAGSAITVDLVAADGAFEGGAILPGFQMTARALAEGTDLLPLVDHPLLVDAPPAVGKSTVAAIRSGLFWGSVGAVRELVARLADQADCPAQLFVSGGDAGRLAPYLARDARVVNDLVLAGIAVAHLGDGD
jgi:type III pantothenate kinase